MSRIVIAILVLFLLSTGMELEISGPEEVEVASSHGNFNAEILSVRDTTLVLVSPSGVGETDLINEKAQIIVMRNDDILSIKSCGSSHVVLGMFLGGAFGCITGCLVGRSLKVEPATNPNGCNKKSEEELREENSIDYAAGFGVGGIFLGGIIGSATSTKDSLWVTPAHRDFKALRALARYPDMAPDFIRRVEK